MDTQNIANTLDGLSSETRLDIFRLLVRAGGGDGLAVGVIAGLGFSWFAFRLLRELTLDAARRLMFASFIYLPLVQIVYVLDKIPPTP